MRRRTWRPARGGSNRKVETVAEVLSRWLGRWNRASGLQLYSIQDRWAALVGHRVAARAQPRSMRDHILTVVVCNSTWLNELTYMRDQIRARINEVVEGKPVLGIRLVAGRLSRMPASVAARRAEPEVPEVKLPPDAFERVDRETREIVDDELRAALKGARLSQIKRVIRLG